MSTNSASCQTFYIFRHGLATHSTTGYGERALTAELLPEGKAAVHLLGEHLKQFPIELGLTSPVPRCLQTARIVTQHTQLPFTIEAALTEYYPEVFEPFQVRLRSLARQLLAHPARHMALCTHGGVIAGLRHLLLGESFTEAQLLEYPQPAGLVIITIGDKPMVKTVEWKS